jgi:MYXO-CTERM domain-containing protein
MGVLAFVGQARAHFRLEAPPAMTEQNALGDPQKIPPCGHSDPTLTGIVTTFAPGETITITIDETIYHPGHYRVVLAVEDPSELPDAPAVTPGATACGSTTIDDPPVFPVLADGELEHSSPFGEPQSFQVTLPEDVECDDCTLQIMQFMSDHAAPCYYYHCATIAITSDPSMTSDGTNGSTGDDSATTDDSGPSTTSAGGSESATTEGGTTSDTVATDTDAAQESDGDDGCGCSTRESGAPRSLLILFVLPALGLRRRAACS